MKHVRVYLFHLMIYTTRPHFTNKLLCPVSTYVEYPFVGLLVLILPMWSYKHYALPLLYFRGLVACLPTILTRWDWSMKCHQKLPTDPLYSPSFRAFRDFLLTKLRKRKPIRCLLWYQCHLFCCGHESMMRQQCDIFAKVICNIRWVLYYFLLETLFNLIKKVQ